MGGSLSVTQEWNFSVLMNMMVVSLYARVYHIEQQYKHLARRYWKMVIKWWFICEWHLGQFFQPNDILGILACRWQPLTHYLHGTPISCYIHMSYMLKLSRKREKKIVIAVITFRINIYAWLFAFMKYNMRNIFRYTCITYANALTFLSHVNKIANV